MPSSEDGSPRPSCGAESPITYRYLTFETPLPSPNTTILASSTRTEAAAAASICPAELDLRPYTNPILWSAHRKAYHLLLCCLATLLTAYTAGSYSPPEPLMEANFRVSRTAVATGITTFCMGFALAPMILAPFSEINGRYPVFAVSGVLYVVFQLVCGLAPNLGGMLVARFLTGVGGSVFSTMIGGIIADLWEKEGRNTPMALFSGSVLVGTGVGPLVTAVMTHRFGDDGDKWKWVFWHQVIMGGVLMALIAVFFKESRGSVVLSRRAKALNKWYEQREQAGYYGVWLKDPTLAADEAPEAGGSSSDGKEKMGPASSPRSVLGATTRVQLVRLRWRVKSDEERSSLGKMISISVYRPFHLLVTEPVVFSFSLWVSFAWAVLYLTFASIPYVFETVYGWDIERAGYVFGAMMVGSVLATIIGIWQDELLKHPEWRRRHDNDGDQDEDWSNDASPSDEENNSRQEQGVRRSGWLYATLRRHFPVESPESRLYFTCITAVLLPVGLFLFGFTSTASIHWIAPTIAICLATMGIYSIYLATFNYFADVYHIYASSALAAQSCCRNVLGGIFPLVTLPLFENLGIARAGGLLGGIALGLTFVPWVLIFFGPRIRARSAFAVKLEKASP
ncbi:MFS general substrate transporter [Cryphonectria parasitica EP155]|uniref:MFS general substrate transporter n=1 Tax=Cryphonectria parasitica (strain ATCC 38755 / EP155) TaxID=660469 RepID=A0A9P4XVJ0_CRYP1|nr:MFS general substrate transporter [Cryphonectria parasitica EP155]KAF3762067.1 MFS general substrate transporter [Cryphonectria parasitica EP155]